MPAAGLPLRRLALRSLRTADLSIHAVLDPVRLGAVRAAGDRRSSPASARRRSSRPAATSRCPSSWRRRRCGSRRAVGGQRDPGPERPRGRPGWRTSLAVSLRGDVPRRSGGRCYVTGTPIRDSRRDRPGRRRARRFDVAPDGQRAPHLRWLARPCGASTPPCRAPCPARRAGQRRPPDRRGGLCRGARPSRAAAGGRCATATGRIRSCATRCWPALAAADLVVGRAGSSTLAEVTAARPAHGRRAVSACRRPPAGQCPGRSSRPGGASWSRTRRSTPRRCVDAAAILDDPAPTIGWPLRRGRWAGRAPPTPSPRSCWPPRAISRPRTRPRSTASREAPNDRLARRPRRQPGARRRVIGSIAARPFDAIALGTDIQRRLGVKTSRDEPLARFTTMRVGGPADLFAVAHNALRAARPGQVRPDAGPAARRARPRQQRGHQRRGHSRPGDPGSGRGVRDPTTTA